MAREEILQRGTFVSSQKALARFVARPVLRFIQLEVASGILLLVATAVALVWVNSPWHESYHDLWETTIVLEVGGLIEFSESLEAFVNDGLMALFFFVVGLEIKRELVVGQLSEGRAAALPAIAALGGMVVPALVFTAFNAGGEGSSGWGIPMATDIAFALGVVALLGSRVHPRLKLFLLALAIVDDIGAIAVIAVFYTDDLSLGWLPVAWLGLVAVVVLQRFRVWSLTPYLAIGLVVWYATLESGVHATIAGVLLGLLTPARPLLGEDEAREMVPDLSEGITVANANQVSFVAKESVSVAERLEYALHPWTSYLVIPVFALANAGIELSSEALSEAATSPLTIGVVLGLVVGKPVGIVGFTWVATRLGLRLPLGMGWPQFIGMGIVAGIGFTVSIFIAGLAFTDEVLRDDAKIGILAGSAIAAVVGLVILRITSRGPAVSEEELAEQMNDELDGPDDDRYPPVESSARS